MDNTSVQQDDMSSKNLADCDTESECGFYSDCWEESVIYNKDLTDSSTESYFSFDSCSLFEKIKGGNNLDGIVLILENSQANSTSFCKDQPLLQGEKVQRTSKLLEELSPESILYLKCKDYNTNGHSLKSFSTKTVPFIYSNSYGDHLCLYKAIPQLNITENSTEGHIIYTVKETYAFDKFHQNQSSDGNPVASKQNKAVQVSSKEIKPEGNIYYECFKQSPVSTEVNKELKKPTNVHSFESHLVSSYSDNSSEYSYQIDNPQIAEQIYSHSSSEEPTLILEAAYIYPADSLASDTDPSDVRVDEDSQRYALGFQFKDSEHNQPFKKLHLTFVPQKQTTNFKKQVGLSQILTDESSYLLGTHSESSESSTSKEYSDQALSTSNLWCLYWPFPPFKYTDANQLPHFFVRSLSPNPVKPAFQKRKPKISKPVKSVVFTKHKILQRDQKCKSKPSNFSKLHSLKTLDIEPTDKRGEAKINEQYMSLNQTSKCHCSPLLDLTVDLHSEDRNSEKFLTLNRSSHKRTRGGKIIHRFSSHYLLSPKNSSERLHYISPVRKKNNLKMQNILNYFLGWTGRQNRDEKYKEDISPTSKLRANETFISHMPAGKRSSTVPLHPHSKNYSLPFSTTLPFADEKRCSQVSSLQAGRRSPTALYSFANECKHSSGPCVEMERDPWSPVESYAHGKYSTSHSPCCANTKVEQISKKLNMFNDTGVEKLNFGAGQLAGGGLALKKFSVCPCGTMSQSALFPNRDISESGTRKTIVSPDSNWRTCKTDSNRWNSLGGTFSTKEVSCSCHHVSPTCCLHNSCKHEAPRNQVIEVASLFENGFPIRNLKEDVEKSKTVKTGERKVKFHLGSDALQKTDLLTTHISSPTNEYHQIPEHFVYQPECSCCQSAVKEHLNMSKEVSNCLVSENYMPKNYLNRESIFLVDPNRGIRSQCKCSHEISLFSPEQIDAYKGSRSEVSRRKDPRLTQESSKINQGWKRLEHCKYCQDKIHHSYLQSHMMAVFYGKTFSTIDYITS